MKAVVYTRYGPPDVLRIADVETPVPEESEVLVKLYAVSLNASDWEGLRGKPLYSRIMGLFRPRRHVLGSDIAGRVEAAGRSTTLFRRGDEVFADTLSHLGGFAEYVCLPESVLARMPAGVTYEQAAALPQAGAIALQGILDKGQVHPGQKGVDQRCGWRLWHVRSSAREASRGGCHRGWTTRRSWSSCALSGRTTSSTTRGKTSPGMGAPTT